MTYIDFQGGAHGNFLELMLNHCLAGMTWQGDVFTTQGAAHDVTYQSQREFYADHYTTQGQTLRDQRIVMIQPQPRDLLALQCVSLYRAGEFNIDPDDLEHDTWHKLSVPVYQPVRDRIHRIYSTEPLLQGYQAISDATWPQISSWQQYHELPQVIRHECQQALAVQDLMWDADHPHCRRGVLRDFFRHGFADPWQHGLLEPMLHSALREHNHIWQWPFGCFYDWPQFRDNLQALAQWLDRPVTNLDSAEHWHGQFMQRQRFAQITAHCDALIHDVLSGVDREFDPVNVIAEAYIEYHVQQTGSWQPDFDRDEPYRHTSQLRAGGFCASMLT
jgi:hypothetical protein